MKVETVPAVKKQSRHNLRSSTGFGMRSERTTNTAVHTAPAHSVTSTRVAVSPCDAASESPGAGRFARLVCGQQPRGEHQPDDTDGSVDQEPAATMALAMPCRPAAVTRIICPTGIMTPAPRPCATRAKINRPTLFAAAHATEARVNASSAPMLRGAVVERRFRSQGRLRRNSVPSAGARRFRDRRSGERQVR